MFLLFFFLSYLYKYFINCLKYSISICYLITVYGIRCVINTHNFQYIIKYLLVENHDLCFVKTFSIQLPVMKKIKIINYNKYKQTREYTPLTIPIKNMMSQWIGLIGFYMNMITQIQEIWGVQFQNLKTEIKLEN